ncbi:zinc ribbon domain-containing protein [Caryophanon latum]|uniref:DZANK-type domain-containing protein n=1 Tax=Caryophanon latum TaxID=33977 RepID=A0A1C0YTB7_9BACL|nr:zinc ribbon domain-containing protein [Caryophanon latum]OCS90407.1 hypothetical protein A6K76_11115 [Caryophanon latum]
MSVNVKEQRQLLAQRKEARILKMMQLGEKVYKKALSSDLHYGEYAADATEILAIDKEIYQLGKATMEQVQTLGKCSECQNAVPPNTKFCGHCGQLQTPFADELTRKKPCRVCEQQIDEQLRFCPCCGTGQGGI